MGEFRILFADMDSFFASVEQHLNPDLRGKPVGIVAVDSNSGACVAASYEAKARGVKTGTPVWEAKRLCPGIALIPSRHRLYVEFNLRVGAILDDMAELERIRSVDEFQIRLSGAASELAGAEALVRAMKARVAREIGPCIRFSAGLGPNHLLGKIASKLEKPNGMAWVSPRNMPDRLLHLKLDDLPGISKGIKAKLFAARIWDIPALYNLDPRHARAIWRSVEGERFVRAFQGMNIPLVETQRGGFGSSKVLAPDFRKVRPAYLVSRWLMEKSARRMRRDGMVTSQVTLSILIAPDGRWSANVKCRSTSDMAYLLQIHRELWERFVATSRGRTLLTVGIHLGNVRLLAERSGDLLLPLGPAETTRGEQVASVVDLINLRFGAETITHGINQPHHGFFERG